LNNYKIVIEYDGSGYNGWQRQKDDSKTIQGILEDSISTLVKEKITLTGSGRTDSGVHALNQVANFKTNSELNSVNFLYSLNGMLPRDITVKKINKVKFDFNARHDAIRRDYIYQITTVKKAIYSKYFHRIYFSPDLNLINSVIPILIGYKSFKSLCRNTSDKYDFKCDVFKINFKENKSKGELYFRISASRFLHSMVRAVGGALLDIGRNKIQPQEFKDKFISGEKIKTTYLPSNGLFLSKIHY